jgi:uncharacterized protein
MPNTHIRYDLLVQDALRSVVRRVLTDAVRDGLPGEHHFNISFRTRDDGVSIPVFLSSRYPDEMAIILQHEFWDLLVADDRFEVSLNFNRKPERLIVPFTAITGFSDPSVPFGFKIEAQTGAAESAPAQVDAAPATASKPTPIKANVRADKKPAPALAQLKPIDTPAPAAASDSPKSKVVSIDAFRKK